MSKSYSDGTKNKKGFLFLLGTENQWFHFSRKMHNVGHSFSLLTSYAVHGFMLKLSRMKYFDMILSNIYMDFKSLSYISLHKSIQSLCKQSKLQDTKLFHLFKIELFKYFIHITSPHCTKNYRFIGTDIVVCIRYIWYIDKN